MFHAVHSTSTSSKELTLYDKTMLSLDYGQLYWDFKKAEVFDKEEHLNEVDCYENVQEVQQYLIDMLSVQSNAELLKSKAMSSSILTDNTERIVEEAIDSALVYEAFKLVSLDEAELEVVNKLRAIKQVIAIYAQRYRSELQIIVFLKSDKYDNELIHKLLDIEYELQKQFRDPVLAFSYIPRIYKNRRDIVHKNAKLIYEM